MKTSTRWTKGSTRPGTSADNPAYVDNSFVYEVGALPLEASAQNDPWPGDYWATANDSINVRWDGDNPSPAEKAEQALNLSGFATAVTNNFGIYGSGAKACTTSADCTSENDGSSCEFPRGVSGAGKAAAASPAGGASATAGPRPRSPSPRRRTRSPRTA